MLKYCLFCGEPFRSDRRTGRFCKRQCADLHRNMLPLRNRKKHIVEFYHFENNNKYKRRLIKWLGGEKHNIKREV